MTDKPAFIYDRVLYPNYIHSQTHPDRLALMSKFYGVNPRPAENCRVLELGCGTGCGLLSFAYDLPDSEFIGIDLSEKQIEIGKRAVEGIGIKNLSLRQGDIMDISRETLGEFDYIIAHGVYSWVPDFVRDQILKICGEMLAEQGIAFVSYNAYPGCHYRKMVREMMLFHTRNIDNPQEKVNEAMGLLQFAVNSSDEKKVHHTVLEKEFKKLAKGNFENILHDDLSDENHPVYFYEFVDHAEKHDLQFVTDVDYFNAMSDSKEVLETLENITGGDVIAIEQYLDFINGRRFRRTLLCRKELKINPTADPRILRQMRLSSSLRSASEDPELATDRTEKFLGKDSENIQINHPLSKAALFHLGQLGGRTISFDELVAAAAQRLEAETDFQSLVELAAGIYFQIAARRFYRA